MLPHLVYRYILVNGLQKVKKGKEEANHNPNLSAVIVYRVKAIPAEFLGHNYRNRV
jgi:hypothetical protein